MFRFDQIMTTTQFIRSFRQVANYLSRPPEPPSDYPEKRDVARGNGRGIL